MTASARRSPPSSSPTNGQALDEAALVAHVREHLAAYKSPKRVLPVATIGRAANGKLDYRSLKDQAMQRLGLA